MDDDEFNLLVDLFGAMLNKALENRARNKAAIDEYYSARREGREPELEKAREEGVKKKRKVPQYSLDYAKNFKKIESKYKKKGGGWKKDGYKKAVKEAHRLTRKGKK